MKRLISLLVLYHLLFTFPLFLPAQEQPAVFEHLSEKDGLSNNSVLSIHQDRDGFMWFGTWEGLNKFDGYTFTVFRPDPNNPTQTLSHNTISDIVEDREGRLWLATRGGGLNLLDKRTGMVTTYSLHPDRDPYWNALADIYEDRQGLFWICGAGGLAKFDLQTRTFTRYASPEAETMIVSVAEDPTGRLWAASIRNLYLFDRLTGKFTPQRVSPNGPVHYTALHIDREGIMWVGTGGEGLFRLDTRSLSPRLMPYNPGGFINKFITSTLGELYEDASGILWLATNSGLQRVNKQTGAVSTFRSDPLQPGSLSNNAVQSVLKDNNGHLWVGTTNGINKWTNNTKAFKGYQVKPAIQPFQLEENNVTSLVEDEAGILWLGSSGKTRDAQIPGGGLFQFDPKLNRIRPINTKPADFRGLNKNQFFVPYRDRAGRMWVGTDHELLCFNRGNDTPHRYPTQVRVQAIAEDRNGKLWFGGTQGGYIFKGALAYLDPRTHTCTYYWYDPKDTTGLRLHNITDLAVSRSGDIWVATPAGGLHRFNPKTRTFRRYLPDSLFTKGTLTDRDIRIVYEDAQGILWLGTNQGGLNRFDPQTEKCTAYTVKEGLPSNHVSSIVEDNRGHLWIGTSKGLSSFNPRTEFFRNYSTLDGLPDNYINRGSKGKDGKLYFGTANGFVIFHPDSIRNNTTIPPVYITQLKVLEKPYPLPEDRLELPYYENFLSFEFAALNYTNTAKNRYAYQLVGIDKDWIYSGTRRLASYTDLSPGTYTFRVKGANNDGQWNERGTQLTIVIRPSWWQTEWAYLGYGLCLLTVLYLARQSLLKRERLKADFRIKAIESDKLRELDTLKSRFFTNISHEFRTPLAIIKGVMDKLGQQDTSTERATDYQLVNRNTDRLLELINQLLDLSRLEAGKLVLHPRPAEVTNFLKCQAGYFESLFESKGITYRYTVPLRPIWLLMDAEKLQVILTNLLSNAHKFTPRGGEVRLSVTLEPSGTEHCDLNLLLDDTGIGIPAAELPRIFDRFHQADPSATRAYEGTGIGLALVKELVDLHQGTLHVESTEGKGTAFRISLPFQLAPNMGELGPEQLGLTGFQLASNQPSPAKAGVPVEENRADAGLPLSQHKEFQVLLVEDNADLRHFLRESLLPFYHVLEAADGQQGLDMALNIIPDLVISDVMMPGLDGLSLCSTLKTDPRTSHIPLILLTAKADAPTKLLGFETGADEYLTKPFLVDELLMRVRNLLEGRKKLRERFAKTFTIEPQEVVVASMDERLLQKALSLVEANMGNGEFDVETFCREIGMSRSHLHRKLTALTGHGPSEFIRTLRLKRAASLLRQHHGNVGEVALGVGFSSLNYFTKCFREHFGKTPSEYARQADLE